MNKSEITAHFLDHVSRVTQLRWPPETEPENVEAWKQTAEKIFRDALKTASDEGFKAGFERGVLELPPDLRRHYDSVDISLPGGRRKNLAP